MDFSSVSDLIRRDLRNGRHRRRDARVVEESAAGGLMDINDWIDQTIAAKDYIQAQEDREDFIL